MGPQARFVTFAPVPAVLAILAAFARAPWTAVRLVSLCVAVPAFVALTVARLQLGDSFSVLPEARALVTHGLYSRIRNPIYVFSILLVTSLLLYVEVAPAIVAGFVLLVVPLQIFRARAESRALDRRFGDEYRRYRASTWF
jgi:protein-S-isoprenylcysteine O-methyltransferase Ste14